jgi:hypothetical protein
MRFSNNCNKVRYCKSVLVSSNKDSNSLLQRLDNDSSCVSEWMPLALGSISNILQLTCFTKLNAPSL